MIPNFRVEYNALPEDIFGIRTTQSTILKNDKKNDRPKVSSSSGHIFS